MSKRKPARTIKARPASKIRSKAAAGSGQPKGRANSKQARVLALLCGPSGATNYVQIEVNHEELGPLTLTIQRQRGSRRYLPIGALNR